MENSIIILKCELDNLFAVIPPLQNVLEPVRQSFDVFFLRYPYCYGYWKKYADIEKKHGNIQDAEEVNIIVVGTHLLLSWLMDFTLHTLNIWQAVLSLLFLP